MSILFSFVAISISSLAIWSPFNSLAFEYNDNDFSKKDSNPYPVEKVNIIMDQSSNSNGKNTPLENPLMCFKAGPLDILKGTSMCSTGSWGNFGCCKDLGCKAHCAGLVMRAGDLMKITTKYGQIDSIQRQCTCDCNCVRYNSVTLKGYINRMRVMYGNSGHCCPVVNDIERVLNEAKKACIPNSFCIKLDPPTS